MTWGRRVAGGAALALAVVGGLAASAQAAGGYLDPAFGSKGTAVVRGANDIAVDPQGRITAIARVSGEISALYRTRLTATGRPDPTFTAGPVIDGWEGLEAGETVLLPDGGSISSWRICCGAGYPIDDAMYQSVTPSGAINAHGAFDALFGTAGMPLPANPQGPGSPTLYWQNQSPGGLVRLPDGRFRACASLAAVDNSPFPPYPAVLWGFTSDGQPDPAVGPDGLRVIPSLQGCGTYGGSDGPDGKAHGLFVDGAGTHLYMIGAGRADGPSSVAVVRTDLNGVPDTTYGDGGTFTLASSAGSYRAQDAEVTRMGTVFIGLAVRTTAPGARSYAAVAKVTPDGALDTAFGTAGVQQFGPSNGSSRLDSLGFLPGSRLVLAMTYATPGKRLGRLGAVSADSARPDVAFGDNGKVLTNLLVSDTVLYGAGGLDLAAQVMPADPAAPLGISVIQRRKV